MLGRPVPEPLEIMAKVLTRAGAMVQAPGMIYKAVVKTVLHYVSIRIAVSTYR